MTAGPDHPTDDGPHRDASHGRPLWQKAVAIVGLIAALLVGIMLFAGGGHSPRPHGAADLVVAFSAGDAGNSQ